jgi:hypothetical protein
MTRKYHRRHFMVTAAAAVATARLHTTQLWGKTIKHKPLDPVNPDILFGTTSSIWGGAGVGGKKTRETPGRSSASPSSACRASNSTATDRAVPPNPKELEKLMDALQRQLHRRHPMV